MAKGSFNGVIKGKKGNTVFYELTNSNNKEKQGWREYKASIANPQSDGQIDQRVKMQAVNNLYRALKPIITRGWENHKYGDPSRRAFLKLALGASFEGPYIVKGSTLAVPIKNVPIMYGSLSPVVLTCPGSGQLPLFINVIVQDGQQLNTVGNISQVFIDNALAMEGDQITFVFGFKTEGSSAIVYRTIDFIVDTSDARSTSEIGMTFANDTYEDEVHLTIDDLPNSNFDAYEYCALCSISRDGDGQHLRSYAEFAMTSAFEALFYGNAEQNAAAKRSYKKNTSASTNWEQVPGEDVVPIGNTLGVINSSDPTAVIITGFRIQNGYAQVYDSNSSMWRYVYNVDVKQTQYHMWLTGDKTTGNMWSQTAPDGASAAQAIRLQVSDDANEADLMFANWIVGNGYVGRFIWGNKPNS